MLCESIESRILDYEENLLSTAQREELNRHLAGCACCRALARHLRQVDAALSVGVKAPVLSAGFDQRLLARIHAAPATLSEAERVERKRRLQDEFEAGLKQIARRCFAWENVLRHLTRPGLAVLAGWAAWYFTPLLTVHIHAQSPGGFAQNLLHWLAASTAFVAAGMALIAPQRWKRLIAR